MRSFLLAALASFVASQTFEASDFNVTEALLAQGVNVSALPELVDLVERSSNLACNIAVRSVSFLPDILQTNISPSAHRLRFYTATTPSNFRMRPDTPFSRRHFGPNSRLK
jgi:hypothetical protein